MQPDEVRKALKAWGHATANRFARMEDGPSRGDSVMAKAKDFAPGTRERAERALIGRDGRSRRLHMAGSLRGNVKDAKGRIQMVYVPLWACDPVPARNDADRPHDNPVAVVDVGIPDELRWIDAAVASIERQNVLRALVVRTEFTISASQQVKARMVAEAYGGSLTLRQYRHELQRAMDWLAGAQRAA